jgi:hypothetical protein
MESHGGQLTPELRVKIRKLIVMARVDYLTFALVVLDMVVKPIGYILVSIRAIDARRPQPTTT